MSAKPNVSDVGLNPPEIPPGRFWRWAFFTEGCLIVLAILLGWLLGKPPLAHLPNFSGPFWGEWLRGIGYGFGAAVPLILLLLTMLRFPNRPWGPLVRFVEREIVTLFQSGRLWQFALVSILAGFGEEMLFRGVLQDLLTGWFGGVTGLVLASLLFGVGHWLTTEYAILAAIIGLYFGSILWFCQGSLLVPIVAHAAYDFAALLILVRWRKTAGCHDQPIVKH